MTPRTKPATASALHDEAEAIADEAPLVEVPTTGEPPAAHVYEALARVMRDLPGIGRDETSEQGYSYRGIEAITKHVQQLLARHRVVFVPEVVHRVTKDLTVNNRPWTEEQLTVQYRVFGPGGAEDFLTVGPLIGLGRDNSDKGTNKAMTQVFKYALLQVLCIGDHKDDADAGPANEADERSAPPPVATPQQEVGFRIRAMTPEQRQVVRDFLDGAGIPRVPAQWTDEQTETVDEYLDHLATTNQDPASSSTAPAAGSDASGAPEGAPEQETATQDPLQEIIDAVEAMSPTEVEQALIDADVAGDGMGTDAERRRVLAAYRATEAGLEL
jgi:hypothetical protein